MTGIAIRNPFTPTFGTSPPLLVGRQPTLDDFSEAIENGPGSPGRATIFTGQRGVGKTVMLNKVEDLARERGWAIISETASAGFVTRLVTEHLPGLLQEVDPDATKRRLAGLTGPFNLGGANWTSADTHQVTMGLRTQLQLAIDLLMQDDVGLLITLDELHRQQVEELGELAVALQHAFRQDLDFAFAGATLPAAFKDLLKVPGLTFLRRAEHQPLGAVSLDEVAAAIRQPILERGRTISEAVCQGAAVATGGYPFMIQLVGYHIWRQHPKDEDISVSDVTAGITAARRRLGSLVHEPELEDLSDVDRTFLLAMAKDDGPSKMADIAARMSVDMNYAGQYRLRLLAAEVILAPRIGVVDFATPYLREYLRDHGASTA